MVAPTWTKPQIPDTSNKIRSRPARAGSTGSTRSLKRRDRACCGHMDSINSVVEVQRRTSMSIPGPGHRTESGKFIVRPGIHAWWLRQARSDELIASFRRRSTRCVRALWYSGKVRVRHDERACCRPAGSAGIPATEVRRIHRARHPCWLRQHELTHARGSSRERGSIPSIGLATFLGFGPDGHPSILAFTNDGADAKSSCADPSSHLTLMFSSAMGVHHWLRN